ncbi:hypothetical protein EDD37DRAFT_617411 [Exophiala viscosa]|uniref:uncharacterized protein n=1 Tax=Exophiala viscosa TaxID=2486360 RepID=UPI00218ED91D|nr:hypothetical protein EDD37DRAFT_617411 [Exophiala viscosa]
MQAISSSGVIVSAPKLWWVFMLAVVLSTLGVFSLWYLYMRYRARTADRMVSHGQSGKNIHDEEKSVEKEE